MVGLRGRLQREGIVTHIIIDRVIDYTPLLRSIGEAKLSAATCAASDGEADLSKRAARDDAPCLRLQSRNFH
jgi:error-prone DNA polymerase